MGLCYIASSLEAAGYKNGVRIIDCQIGVDFEEFKSIMETRRGFVKSGWCGDAGCEARVKEETKATIRCIPLDGCDEEKGRCLACGRPAQCTVYLARAY